MLTALALSPTLSQPVKGFSVGYPSLTEWSSKSIATAFSSTHTKRGIGKGYLHYYASGLLQSFVNDVRSLGKEAWLAGGIMFGAAAIVGHWC